MSIFNIGPHISIILGSAISQILERFALNLKVHSFC